MVLYDRDYLIPDTKEKEAIRIYDEWENSHSNNRIINTAEDPRNSIPDIGLRIFLWHYTSIFPNNHLIFPPLYNVNYLEESNEFRRVVYTSKNEQDIQTYIKENKKWFIPGSIFLDYNFGHHDAYLFPEHSLGGKYRVDYLLIGFNSDGCNLVLVEFEKANTDFIISTSNSEAESVRKGITQIRDWRSWIDDYRLMLLKEIGLTKHGIDVPSTRIYYYLVVSRRHYMNENAKILRSQMVSNDAHLKIVSFDRLIENVEKLKDRISW